MFGIVNSYSLIVYFMYYQDTHNLSEDSSKADIYMDTDKTTDILPSIPLSTENDLEAVTVVTNKNVDDKISAKSKRNSDDTKDKTLMKSRRKSSRPRKNIRIEEVAEQDEKDRANKYYSYNVRNEKKYRPLSKADPDYTPVKKVKQKRGRPPGVKNSNVSDNVVHSNNVYV